MSSAGSLNSQCSRFHKIGCACRSPLGKLSCSLTRRLHSRKIHGCDTCCGRQCDNHDQVRFPERRRPIFPKGRKRAAGIRPSVGFSSLSGLLSYSLTGDAHILSNTGIHSSGALTTLRCPPEITSPVSVFFHSVPSGKYTLRLRAPISVTGATRYFSPNIY